MNPEIFREYDIRGIAGKDMNEEDVISLGKAIGTLLKGRGCKTLSLARDCRTTSESYAQNLTAGLLSTGCDVIDIGICPTPVFYFSIHHLKTHGGVMVTASHNPKAYNGFKICHGLDSVHGEELKGLLQIIHENRYAQGTGIRYEEDVLAVYEDYLVENITIEQKLKVGVDCGNGTAGPVILPLLDRLGCRVENLYCDMDGDFPNHEADPTVLENMQDLIAMVREKGLDLGIGFDGDSDRIGVVDETGKIIYGDRLMILFAREILSRKPGSTFISEVKCSKTLYDDIEKHGGKAIMWKTGHSLIKEKMKVEKAEFAGEMSGHMFFADRYLGYDDALYAACRLLEILSSTGKRISELLADVPETFTTPEIRMDCPDSEKFDVVEKVRNHLMKRYEIIDIDGVRVLFDDGWGLVRASNTQPALVLRFEAMSEHRLGEIRKLVESVVTDMRNI